ncbi:MAG: DUF5320 family protein [Desulfosarcina sp.]|nr:DUF5320 family protein [Desulfobacterales bacterium]
MPGLDGSGPQGGGPMTGGGRGVCNTAAPGYGGRFVGGYYGRGMGRGFRGGYGNGIGMRRGFAGNMPVYGSGLPVNETSEVNSLKAEADHLKNILDNINSRVAELEKSSE